jgi:hypothetical protein
MNITLREFLKRLIKEGIPVEKAISGSYAREKKRWCDIDVMVVSEFLTGIRSPVQTLNRQPPDSRLEPYTVGRERFLNDRFSSSASNSQE